MIQKVNATDARIEEFKSWDGPQWFRNHLNWLKGSYHMAQLPVKRDKKKAPKVHTIPFYPNVSHASSKVRKHTGKNDKDLVKVINDGAVFYL